MRDNLADARKAAANYISQTLHEYVDGALRVAIREARGLRWTVKWLTVMIEEVNSQLEHRVTTIDPSADRRAALNRELSAISEVEASMFGANRRARSRVRTACATLKAFFENEVTDRAVTEKINEVLIGVRTYLEGTAGAALIRLAFGRAAFALNRCLSPSTANLPVPY